MKKQVTKFIKFDEAGRLVCSHDTPAEAAQCGIFGTVVRMTGEVEVPDEPVPDEPVPDEPVPDEPVTKRLGSIEVTGVLRRIRAGERFWEVRPSGAAAEVCLKPPAPHDLNADTLWGYRFAFEDFSLRVVPE